MRFRNLFCIVLLAAAAVSCPALPHPFAVSIQTVDPGYLIAEQQNVVLLTGRNLNKKFTCVLVPVTVAATDLQEDTNATSKCRAKFIQGSRQLEVMVIPQHIVAPLDFVLKLFSTKDVNAKTLDPTDQLLAITVLHVIPLPGTPNNSTFSSPAAPSPSSTSPFADCLNANASPSTALTARGSANSSNVNCASSLLTESEVTDNFGRHVDKTYFAIQVRVSNQNTNYDFLLRDILMTLPDGRVVSGRIRRFAQGVAVKGKSLDRRAVFYNSLQSVAGLYGGLSVLATPGFQTAGNALQGALLAGFSQVFPDYTTENVNRFNNAVFDDQSPMIVPKDGIGQPPLYVIALVPKTGGQSEAVAFSFGKRIAVSLEGTFIKQVSLVSVSPSNLAFTDDYIYPAAMAVPADRLKDAQTQNIVISNNNQSSLSVTGVDILNSTGASGTSKDFVIDPIQTDCIKQPAATAWSPTQAFVIGSQSKCTIVVRFTPQTAGPLSANLMIKGDNLDGTQTVALKGNGVGIYYDFAHLTGLPSENLPANLPAFTCSYSAACLYNLGYVGTTATLTLPVYFYVPAGTTSYLTAFLDDTDLKLGTTCPGSSTPPAPNIGVCSLSLDLSKVKTPASGSGTLKLTAGNGWTSTVQLTFNTMQTTVVLTPSPASPVSINVPTTITATATGADRTPIDGTNATFSVAVAGVAVGSPTIAKVTKGAATFSFTPISSGTYTITATTDASGIYAAKTKTLTIAVVFPTAVIQGPTDSIGSGGTSVTVPILVAVPHSSVICSGVVAETNKTGLNISGGSLDGTGKTTLSITATTAGPFSNFQVSYPGDDKNCGAASPITLTLNISSP